MTLYSEVKCFYLRVALKQINYSENPVSSPQPLHEQILSLVQKPELQS